MTSLEKRTVQISENGKTVGVPALSPKWVEKRKFLHFVSPSTISNGIDLKDWCEITQFLKNDLHWLLKLPHHKFWSQIIYDKPLNASLVSFLQEAPRFYSEEKDALKALPTAWKLFKETQDLVFLTFVRMATHKESKDCYISPEMFGKLIYDNFIFDVPKMMDLCVLYGPTNSVLLSKMFKNIFVNQPKYKYDLEETAKGLVQVFQLILGQLGLESSQAAGSIHCGPLSVEELGELVVYTLDIAATLWYFIDIYPEAAPLLIDATIQNQLSDFYEKSIPSLCRQIETLSPNMKDKMVLNLNLARKFLIQIYNALLHSGSVKLLLAHSHDDPSWDREQPVELWLDWLTCLVSERQRHFIIDYNLIFQVQDDIDLITQLGIQMDSTRVEYIKLGLKEFRVEFGLSLTPASLRSSDGGVDPAKISALILQVKELLPDLHESFIRVCLKHYDYNPEAVINAVLEDNLPPHLNEGHNIPDQQQPIPEPFVAFDEQTDISKKNRTKTVHFNEMRELLNDKQDMKHIILDRVDEQLAAEYEDEYDDTYDGHAVGSEEPDAHTGEDELRRSFVVPRILRPKMEEESEEEEENYNQTEEKPRDHFVTNPEEMRALAEQRRLSRRGNYRPGPAPSQRNVVGGPRGQGQEKETIVARRHKTENKTRGANHNRRYMADRKRREF
ncbi:activating signal cointegrator 1 complex subunit 2-like [Daphnia pulex]|uniref:activating signal cointegrator 1 complex subunit 2-like n=1 Tax=Daphnia pulex TaxID=6669 RepID=UPI001EDEB439|nr:activating signal cointegrator 1 complex subunit 2-like [Daphnia pulex]XP_046441125.1 activating signal cointegrator 1 complex subunit 2-like [Daphnia pulex]XP_046441126.1 activating signal cointegrator 1 complex subunit 2-like [Daphnia pulex]